MQFFLIVNITMTKLWMLTCNVHKDHTLLKQATAPKADGENLTLSVSVTTCEAIRVYKLSTH